MTVWDFIAGHLPEVVIGVILIGLVIVFTIGIWQRGLNFIRYGMGQATSESALEKRFESIDKHFESIDKRFEELKEDMSRLDSKIVAIETNHFKHLKGYLGILNGVLLDHKIIDNETRARLDAELQWM